MTSDWLANYLVVTLTSGRLEIITMKKNNLILLTIICIISLSLFSGLLVYAFDLQSKKDAQDKASNQQKELTTDTNTSDGDGTETAKPTPTPSSVSTDADNPDQNTEDTDPGESSEDENVSPTVTAAPDLTEVDEAANEPIILGFAGDVNLNETSYPAKKYDSEGKDIKGCLSEDLLEEMISADIMMLNNEFAYSTRGTQTPDKSYTFCADPSRVEIMQKMGVDIVSLANNHALDYGPDALEDTFTTLDGAEIDYIGAGENLARAKAPMYYSIGDKTIAYVAASRVVFAMDWYASENGLGMIGTYDPTLILESIKEAEANSDFVIMYVHWGVERAEFPEDYQRNLAKMYIDAGADAVIGCHPHVMQGMEFYQGKPIIYSLGNFWFNNSTKESGMIKLYLNPDDTVQIQLLPAMAKNTFTYLLTDSAEKENYYSYIQSLCYNAKLDENGFITETE